ncbi:MAG: hypothetical protein JWR08_1394 [Enterovirga sp.]|nr:hypothetical protein [Enterovirga sp.]
MRRTALFATALLGLLTAGTIAEAQERIRAPLRIMVRPRSWLDAGNVTQPYSSVNPASALGQQVSYLASPPWAHMRDRFGEGTLPDPVTNGPFVGAQNVLGPVDYNGLYDYSVHDR